MENLLLILKSKTVVNAGIGLFGGIIAFLLQEQRGFGKFIQIIFYSVFSATVLAPFFIFFISQSLGIETMPVELERAVIGIISISSYELLPALKKRFVKKMKNEKIKKDE